MLSAATTRKIRLARDLYLSRPAPEGTVKSGYVGYFEAAIAQTPESVLRRLTAQEVADLALSVERGWRTSRDAERRDILAEGCVWDGKRLREVA